MTLTNRRTFIKNLTAAGIDVLLDDREDRRPGAKFADAELIGFPHRVVVGERGLADNLIEYTSRKDGTSTDIDMKEIVGFVTEAIGV